MGRLQMRTTFFLCFFIVAVLMIPTIALINYNAKQNIERASSDVWQETEDIANKVSEDIQSQFTLLGRMTTSLLGNSMFNILKDDKYDYKDYSDIQRRTFVEDYLYSLCGISDYIDGIFVISENNNIYYSSNYAIVPEHNEIQADIFKTYGNWESSEWCVSPHIPWLAWNHNEDPVITIGRRLADLQGNTVAIAYIDINVNHFEELLSSQQTDIVFDSYILDSDNEIVAGFNITDYEYDFDYIESGGEETVCILDGEKAYVKTVTTPGSNWKIITVLFDETLQNTVESLYMFRNILIVAYICIYILLLMYVLFKVYKPLRLLTGAMVRIEKGDFTAYVDYNAKGEYGYLVRSYNNMLRELNAQIEQKYIIEIKKKNAEFNYLKGRINPHFILNTMQIISSTAVVNEDFEVEEIVDKFCDILRYSLYNDGWKVSLKNEMDHVKKYFELKKRSLGWQTKLKLFIDDDALDFCVTKMVLQPLAENCFYHGLRGRTDEQITIRAYMETEFLVLSVKDNGVGIPEEKLTEIRKQLNNPSEKESKTGGIALNNIALRMKILYGEDGKMEINSAPGAGTEVSLFFPKQQNEQIEDYNS